MGYKGVDSEVWYNKEFKKLSALGKLLFLYVCTTHKANHAGIIEVTLDTIEEDTAIPEQYLETLFIELENLDIEWDAENERIWVKNYLEHQAHSPTYMVAVEKCLLKEKDKHFVARYLDHYRDGVINNKTGTVYHIPYRYGIDTLPITIDNRLKTKDKEQETTSSDEQSSEHELIFETWNEQKVISHRAMTDKMKRAIKTALKQYSCQEIQEAIKTYADIVHDESYFFNFKWNLDEFLKRGLEKFMNAEVAKSNFRKEKGKGQGNGGGQWSMR